MEKKQNKKYVTLFVPHNLEHLTKNIKTELGFKDKTKKYLKNLYLLDIISNLLSKKNKKDKNRKNKNDNVKRDGFRLSSEILRKKYGTHYNFYIDYLINNEILLLIEKERKGIRSRKYKINPEIDPFFYRQFRVYDEFFIKKKEKINKTITELSKNVSIIEDDIKKIIEENLYSIEIKGNEARKYIEILLEKGILEHEQYISAFLSIEAIENNNQRCSFDKFGRVHTNYTNLKKEIRRNFITIDGLEICELDIKNCQPTMLITLLQENLDKIHGEGKNVFKIDKNEFRRYVEHCKNGLYKVFVENSTLRTNLRSGEDINNLIGGTKDIVFRVLFGKNKRRNSHDKVFRLFFPTIYKFICFYKKDNHKVMAHELQRRESNLLFGKIIREIITKYPGIKFYTIHDSIAFQKYHKKEVEKIFNKHVEKIFIDAINETNKVEYA